MAAFFRAAGELAFGVDVRGSEDEWPILSRIVALPLVGDERFGWWHGWLDGLGRVFQGDEGPFTDLYHPIMKEYGV
jgi:hypothetical protein